MATSLLKNIIMPIIFLITIFPVRAEEIKAVLIYPVFDEFYSCAEHWAEQFNFPGDALGTDCIIQKLENRNGRTWLRAYKGEGK